MTLSIGNESFRLAEGSFTTGEWKNMRRVNIRGVPYFMDDDGNLCECTTSEKHYRSHGDYTETVTNHTEKALGYGQINLSGQNCYEMFGEDFKI